MRYDILYPIGTGSKWNDNELRFSLRSIEKNMKSIRNVYIIGRKPEWATNVIHIYQPDILMNNADGNIIMKVMKAAKEERLSNEFLFMNDDHFIMKPIKPNEILNYHKAILSEKTASYFNNNMWSKRLLRTKKLLESLHKTTYHYDCHTPILINKAKFIEIFENIDYKSSIGYTMKSTYGNIAEIEPKALEKEKVMIKSPFDHQKIERIIADATFLSIKDEAINQDFEYFIHKRFPKKSKYEISDVSLTYNEPIIKWLDNQKRNIETGKLLLNNFYINKQLNTFLDSSIPEIKKMKKITYELNKLIGRDLNKRY